MMNNKKVKEEINLKCSIKAKKITRTLKELLKLCNKSQLDTIYTSIEHKEIYNNKQNLVNKLYDKLTKEEVIKKFLKDLIKNEYDILIELLNNNGLLQDNYIEFSNYYYLFNYGVAYPLNYENKVYIVIPNEILDIIKDINIYSYKDKILQNNKIYDLVHSMINLYGAVPFDFFLNSLRKYYGYKDFKNLDLDCIYFPDRKVGAINVSSKSNTYIINPTYLDEETDKTVIYRVISLLEDDLFEFDFKEISLDDLLKYKDMYYYEKTDSVLKFIKYLESKNVSYENMDLLVACLIQIFRKNYQEGILFINEVFEDDLIIKEDNIDEILPYINNIVSDISIWGNKGWTTKDIILNKHLN